MKRRFFAIDKLSQKEEGKQLREFFGNRPSGFYVDVGANDPFNGSVSWAFEQMGWTGLLVEPIPALAQRLREERKGKVFQCACSTHEDAGKSLKFWIHPKNSGWSTLVPALSPWAKEDLIETTVEIRTLDDVLESAGSPKGFELLALDVEFHEISVLSGCDLSRWAPQLIFVEDHAHNHRLLQYMDQQGYRIYRRSSLNSWFVPKDSPARPTLAMKWGVFRKYYLSYPIRKVRLGLKKILARRTPADPGPPAGREPGG